MKKKKFLKFIVTAMLSCFFLVTVSSCGSNGLDGGICGEAKPNGENAFSNIRRYYCEQWTYNYYSYFFTISENIDDKGNVTKYGEFKDEYANKFIINETNTELVNVEVGNDNYNNAHYIFTYYAGNNKNLVENYVNSNVNNPSTYLELVNQSANDSKFGYFPKVANTDDDKSNSYSIDNTSYSVRSYLDSHSKACLVFTDNFVDPQTGITINKMTWKDAFTEEGGFLTGIFTYPMAWFVNLFVKWFGGYGTGTGAGWGQIGAILLTTIILKLAVFLLTFKSQSSTQKMQDIQPEILKIQAKYGQTPSAEDKQRMSMELMAVYQKYGIKPLAPFASLLITFPVFIAMYRAVTYLAVLRTGEVGGVVLGNTLNTYIIGGSFKFTALIIFILMAASQVMSMKLPQILNRKRMSREAKQQQKQTNMMSNVMMIMILVMGFFMPTIMSIYWIASALVSVGQSLIMHKLNNGNKKGKYKVKKADNGPTKIPQGYKSN